METIDHPLDDLYWSDRFTAGDRAVYRPLLGTLTDQAEIVRRTRKMWRNRLGRLHELGLPLACDGRHYTFMYNCQPEGPRHQAAYYCHRRRLCPWCWHRLMTVPVFKSLDRAFKTYDGLHAVLVQARKWIPYGRLDWDGLENVLRGLGQYRRYDKDRVERVRGSAITLTLEPEDGHWIVSRRTLMLVPASQEVPISRHTEQMAEVRISRWHDLTEGRDRAIAAGMATRYPAGLLRGDPEQASSALQVLERTRLRQLSRSGELKDRQSAQN
jgi:hypothetical protein